MKLTAVRTKNWNRNAGVSLYYMFYTKLIISKEQFFLLHISNVTRVTIFFSFRFIMGIRGTNAPIIIMKGGVTKI
jgi:hypothetical protein